MKALINFFLDNNKFTAILILIITALGLQGLSSLNSESYPTVELGVAIVVTPYPGAGPEDVEADITKPIEDAVREVRGLKKVKSVSQIGLSRIVIQADIDNYDVTTVMDDISSAIKGVSGLPAGLPAPIYTEVKSEEFPALEIAIVGDNTDRKRDIFADFVKEKVEDLKGVLHVSLNGFQDREFSIYLDRKKLNKFHVGADEVTRTLIQRNVSIPAGDLVSHDQQFLVRLDGKIDTVEELLSIPIRTNYSGKMVLLRDIAQVLDGKEDPTRLASVNGEAATLLVVTKRSGADTIALVGFIEKLLADIEVPEGLKIAVYHNEAKKVKNRTEVLISNAYIGLILVIAFMLIFLPGRVGLMASLSLPVALFATFGMMPALGMNLNVITICALVIALGMLVDNSVVIAENYVRLREEGLSPSDAAVKAAHQFWLPITCTVLTTVAGFLPMLVTKGVLGQFISYIPIIVTLSLIASLIESFFLLPMRLKAVDKAGSQQHVNNKSDSESSDKEPKSIDQWFTALEDRFELFMDKLIRHRVRVAGVFLILLLGSTFLLFGVNKFVLFPAEQTEVYIARFEMEKGTPLHQTQLASEKLSGQIKEIFGEDVEYLVALSGKSEQDISDPKAKEGDSVGILKIFVTPEASLELNSDRVIKQMQNLKTPYFKSISYSALINGPPVGSPVNLTFRSHNAAQLKGLSYELLDQVKSISGIRDPAINDSFGDDEVDIQLDHGKIQRLGLSVAQVGSTIKDLLGGKVIAEMNINNKKFKIRMRLGDKDKESLKDLKNIMIMDRQGNLIQLNWIAKLVEKEGALVIRRYDYQRAKTLTADIDTSLITSGTANKQIISLYEELKTKYPEVNLAIGGEEESTRESMQSLAQALGLAMLGIFAVLVFLFRSYLRPLIIMSTIPLGITGVSIAFLIHDKPVSFLAMIGIIGLAGIIVNSGIVLISFIDELRAERQGDLHTILVQASRLRLKAVMVTSLTTISGLLPTAYGWGGRDLILMPMTLAMAWGLVTGTILTLIWVPCAYALLEDFIGFAEKHITFKWLADLFTKLKSLRESAGKPNQP